MVKESSLFLKKHPSIGKNVGPDSPLLVMITASFRYMFQEIMVENFYQTKNKKTQYIKGKHII